jgi:hypothetical protein
VRFLEGDLDAHYDWSGDVMNAAWDPAAARHKLRARPQALAADALLDQDVFAGVGNIIKNEVLWRIRVHPESTIGALPPRKLGELVRQAREYSFDFLAWKKAFVLKKHYQVHTKQYCPRDGARLSYRKELGEKRRRAFFCEECQVLYRPAGMEAKAAKSAKAAKAARPATAPKPAKVAKAAKAAKAAKPAKTPKPAKKPAKAARVRKPAAKKAGPAGARAAATRARPTPG